MLEFVRAGGAKHPYGSHSLAVGKWRECDRSLIFCYERYMNNYGDRMDMDRRCLFAPIFSHFYACCRLFHVMTMHSGVGFDAQLATHAIVQSIKTNIQVQFIKWTQNQYFTGEGERQRDI